jgi:hypothetical protein
MKLKYHATPVVFFCRIYKVKYSVV